MRLYKVKKKSLKCLKFGVLKVEKKTKMIPYWEVVWAIDMVYKGAYI